MKACTLLFTGLPCSGKTTLANALAEKLRDDVWIQILDGDIIRKELWTDLGFSPKDRMENLKRVSYISQMLNKNSICILASFVSPLIEIRQMMRDTITNFIEIYVKCSAEECAKRDVKGMWAKAKKEEVKGFTGYDAPYEEYNSADIIVDTEKENIEKCVNKIMNFLNKDILNDTTI